MTGGQWTWIGGYQDDQENWMWSDGTPFTGLKLGLWAPYQPDNTGGREDYLGIKYFNGWGRFDDWHHLGKICQYDLHASTGKI